MIATYADALAYLYSHIPDDGVKKFPGDWGHARMQELMHRLGNPQETYQVFHIAGTSGKGSTAYLTSLALHSQKLRVGLHLSPHLLDIRERVQIDGTYISEKDFVASLQQITPIVDTIATTEFGSPTYFEILVALAYVVFAKQNVDCAVIETGMGGLVDGTNVVKNPEKICIITPIGLDHTNILGSTIPEIAAQKAGIIHKNNLVVTGFQDREALSVIAKHAADKSAHLVTHTSADLSSVEVNIQGTSFVIEEYHKTLMHGLVGEYQAQNALLAVSAVYEYFKTQGKVFNWEMLQEIYAHAHFPGRFDIRTIDSKTVVIDGAHNPQKMHAFLASLTRIFPDKTFTFLIAFKQGKDSEQMLKQISPFASLIILTSFVNTTQDMANISEDPRTIASQVREKKVIIEPDIRKALDKALQARDDIVATGSLYFVSALYDFFLQDKK